jgi:hypothetical protein
MEVIFSRRCAAKMNFNWQKNALGGNRHAGRRAFSSFSILIVAS